MVQVRHLRLVISSQAPCQPPPTMQRPDPAEYTRHRPIPAKQETRREERAPQMHALCALNRSATPRVRRSEWCRMSEADTRVCLPPCVTAHAAPRSSPRTPMPWPPSSNSVGNPPQLEDPILPSPGCWSTTTPERPSGCPNPAFWQNAQPSGLLSSSPIPLYGA